MFLSLAVSQRMKNEIKRRSDAVQAEVAAGSGLQNEHSGVSTLEAGYGYTTDRERGRRQRKKGTTGAPSSPAAFH